MTPKMMPPPKIKKTKHKSKSGRRRRRRRHRSSKGSSAEESDDVFDDTDASEEAESSHVERERDPEAVRQLKVLEELQEELLDLQKTSDDDFDPDNPNGDGGNDDDGNDQRYISPSNQEAQSGYAQNNDNNEGVNIN